MQQTPTVETTRAIMSVTSTMTTAAVPAIQVIISGKVPIWPVLTTCIRPVTTWWVDVWAGKATMVWRRAA